MFSSCKNSFGGNTVEMFKVVEYELAMNAFFCLWRGLFICIIKCQNVLYSGFSEVIRHFQGAAKSLMFMSPFKYKILISFKLKLGTAKK